MLAQRFACTQCGLCCNRAPEVELSEAAALADVFVFRLMLLLHRLPRGLGDYRKRHPDLANAAETYFEQKRFVTGYAAHKRPVRTRGPDGAVEETEYLILTALTLDLGQGRCSALEGVRCRGLRTSALRLPHGAAALHRGRAGGRPRSRRFRRDSRLRLRYRR